MNNSNDDAVSVDVGNDAQEDSAMVAMIRRMDTMEQRLQLVERATSILDSVPDTVTQFGRRLSNVENAMTANGGLAPVAVPRDEKHEAAEVVHRFKCETCGCEGQRRAKRAHSHAKEIPCGACGRIAQYVTSDDVADGE